MIVDSSLEMSANKQAREPFVPDFDLIDTFVTPWSNQAEIAWNGQIITMGILVSLACGLVGSFIVVRKLALMGDAISHVNAKRGEVRNMENRANGVSFVTAVIPLSAMFGYATELRSATQGRGTYTMQFSHYASASAEAKRKLLGE